MISYPEYVPLCVPIWQENYALRNNVKYDKDFGFYIENDPSIIADFSEWIPAKYNPELKGAALLPDMLPLTSWEKNLRTILNEEKWDKIRRNVYAAAGFRCEICGNRGKLEAHEKWKLINETQVQKLEKIVAVCPTCHKAYHIGFAKSSGMLPDVKRKLMDVNGWTIEEVDKQLQEAYEIWQQRCEWDWTLDIELIYNNGYLYL